MASTMLMTIPTMEKSTKRSTIKWMGRPALGCAAHIHETGIGTDAKFGGMGVKRAGNLAELREHMSFVRAVPESFSSTNTIAREPFLLQHLDFVNTRELYGASTASSSP